MNSVKHLQIPWQMNNELVWVHSENIYEWMAKFE